MISGKKVVITGIDGRMGGGIADYFIQKNNEVWGYDLFHRSGSQSFWEDKGVHTVVGDMSAGEFTGLPKEIDYCINLAANVTPAEFDEGMRDNVVAPTLLMRYFDHLGTFMHFSSAAQYTPPEDPFIAVTENDLVGAKAEGFYSGSKIASEGAIRAIAQMLEIPTIQLRPSVHYGMYGDGGLLIAIVLNNMLNELPIEILKDRPTIFSGIYQNDVNYFMESLLNAATIEAPIINLVSDDYMDLKEVVSYISQLTGLQAIWEEVDILSWPAQKVSPNKRLQITGPSQYSWREGVKELIDYWYPRLASEKEMNEHRLNNQNTEGRFSESTLIKEIASLPNIIEFLTEQTGQKVAPFALKIGGNMTIKKAGSYLKWTDVQIKDILEKLNKLYS